MTDPYGEIAVEAITDENIRCWRCNKLLASMATQPWRLVCPRCKALNQKGLTSPE
jgi:phage FluMu protein Com